MADNSSSVSSAYHPERRSNRLPIQLWWRRIAVSPVDHQAVVDRIIEDSGWSARYIFMTMMSAGIAVLGLLLSSPAVVIGAMLISPLMSPIIGLGFSLAMFDFVEMRRALGSLAIGSFVAVGFTALIVVSSPLQGATTEILSRTRPNLFDLLVALFAALAGALAIIRGRGETIVGVAIATALMPPLAVIGYGLATGNIAVITGALALYATNLLTIALAATVVARFFGFGHQLSGKQSWAQTVVLVLAFLLMSIPLALSLNQIAREAVISAEVRSSLADQFGPDARITQLDIDFDAEPLAVLSVVIAPRTKVHDSEAVERVLAGVLGRPVQLHLDQVLLDPSAGSVGAQRAELRQASPAAAADIAATAGIARMVAVAAGVDPAQVTTDRERHRAVVAARALPGASGATYRALEARARAAAPGWQIEIVPPISEMAPITFDDGRDELSIEGKNAVRLAAWQAKRWNVSAIRVSGLASTTSEANRMNLGQRRAKAIADLLAMQGIAAVSGPPGGAPIKLSPALVPAQ